MMNASESCIARTNFLERRSVDDSSKTAHTGDVEDNALGAPKVVSW